MAQSSTEHHKMYQARRLAIRLHPPCVYLEYEERRRAQPPKPRVRTVNLPVLHGHEDVADLVKKVLLSFPRHLDPATVKHQELNSLVYKLVAHAAHQQEQHCIKQDSMQRPHKAAMPKIGITGSPANPSQHLRVKTQRLSLDNAPMVVSVLRSITQCPAGTALAQQLQANAEAQPMQRCVQLLDWVFDVYSHIPASHLKAIPAGSAPSPELEASIVASVHSVTQQSVDVDDNTEGYIRAYRPGSLPGSSQQPEASKTTSRKSGNGDADTMAPSINAWTGVSKESVVGAVSAAASEQDVTAIPLDLSKTALPQATGAVNSAQQRIIGQATHMGGVPSAWASKGAAGEVAGHDSAHHASTSSAVSSSSATAQQRAAPAAASSDDEDDCLTLEVEVHGDVDLNKVSDYELKLAKEAMNKDFQKALLRPGDSGFEYDRQIEFAPPVEANEWDDDASDSDESVF